MKIDVLCNDGSPIGIIQEDIYGALQDRIGIGGAELALFTLCQQFVMDGHEVTLYNSPRKKSAMPIFRQEHIESFQEGEDRDILIIFRSPNPKAYRAKGLKIWWSCDQYTVGNYQDFAGVVSKVVVISDFHKNYFKNTYHINEKKLYVIDIPVRVWEYENDKNIPKNPNLILFSSIPDRGLVHMKTAWNRITQEYPEAELFITSDYRLWGAESPMNQKYRVDWIGEKIKFWGAVPRTTLIKYQLQANILAYPCIYDELFCISVAEAQVAGAVPVTTGLGALSTTNMGFIVSGDPRYKATNFAETFSNTILDFMRLSESEQEKYRKEIQDRAIERFSPWRIANEWYARIFNQ